MKVSLWDEMLFVMRPTLETTAINFSVVVAKRLTVKNYGGVSLSAKNSSSFTIDPPIEDVAELKSWFDSLPESELQKITSNQSIAISKRTGLQRIYGGVYSGRNRQSLRVWRLLCERISSTI
ncbi:hypothetical protein LIER_05257 [Lithospermum erythrorhizon]|uniref:Uncharacterized protein n=1 Tax=Lithospermum erythrorhizon TaxID=34254 RepID=A0AAV3P4P9_LITER